MIRFLLVLAAFLACGPATAAELLMFRSPGCPWCVAWDRQVGPVYGKTEVGRRAPVRFVAMEKKEPLAVSLRSPVRFSPTFVLVDAGREVGRIEGYPGEDFFWGLLEKLVATLPPAPSGALRATAPAALAALEVVP